MSNIYETQEFINFPPTEFLDLNTYLIFQERQQQQKPAFLKFSQQKNLLKSGERSKIVGEKQYLNKNQNFLKTFYANNFNSCSLIKIKLFCINQKVLKTF